MCAQLARFEPSFPAPSRPDRPSTLCSSRSAQSVPPNPLPVSAQQIADHADHSEITAPGNVTSGQLLVAVWSSSVGSTWTLRLRELDGNTRLGRATDWISSGVPISEPEPTALAGQLLAARGLRLCRECTGYGTHSRHCVGYVFPDTELVTPASPRDWRCIS